MTTLENFDHWLLRGLSGVLKLLKLRATYPAGFSPDVVQVAKINERSMQTIVATIEDNLEPRKPNEPASLASVDHWIAQGYMGLNNQLLERLNDDAEYSPHTVDVLVTERDKLTKVIEALRKKCVTRNPG